MQNLNRYYNELQRRNYVTPTSYLELIKTFKDLLEKKYKNESQLQELRLKQTTLQDEYTTIKNELTNLRKQNTSLDSELHGSEKMTNQLRTKIAVLEQEIKDKMVTINKEQDMLSSEQAQKKQLEDDLKEKENALKKKQAEINHYVNEFKKVNLFICFIMEIKFQ